MQRLSPPSNQPWANVSRTERGSISSHEHRCFRIPCPRPCGGAISVACDGLERAVPPRARLTLSPKFGGTTALQELLYRTGGSQPAGERHGSADQIRDHDRDNRKHCTNPADHRRGGYDPVVIGIVCRHPKRPKRDQVAAFFFFFAFGLTGLAVTSGCGASSTEVNRPALKV